MGHVKQLLLDILESRSEDDEPVEVPSPAPVEFLNTFAVPLNPENW